MVIEREGSEWVVKSEDGSKVLGRHKSKADAEAQLRAIEASKARAAHARAPGRMLHWEGGRWL